MVCQLKKVFAMRPQKPEEKTVPLSAAALGMGPACVRIRVGQGALAIAADVHPAAGLTS